MVNLVVLLGALKIKLELELEVTEYNELRHQKECTSVSYGLHIQITLVFYLNLFI